MRVRYRSWRQRALAESSGKQFYWLYLSFLADTPEGASFKSSLTKIVRKDRATRDLTSSQVFFCLPRPHRCNRPLGINKSHGIPGTPVGDLFPLGNALLGDGNRSSIRPIRAGELRSHSAGQFLHLRQGDHEQMASSVTFELEEQTASAVREAQLRDECAQAASELRTELSGEAAQRFQYLEQQQNIFAQARLRTVESALGTEYAQAQQNLQQQYLTQVQGLHHDLQTAQRQFSEQLSQEREAKNQEMEALRRELAGKAQLIREQANDLQQNARMHREMHENEEARAHETLAAQAER